MCIGSLITGATNRKTKSSEIILWTGYWNTEYKDGQVEKRYYCVVSENNVLRKLTIYKPTSKGNKKIYSLSSLGRMELVFPEMQNPRAINLYCDDFLFDIFRVLECDPRTDKIRMTFELACRSKPEIFIKDDGTSYIVTGDETTSFVGNDYFISYNTAVFYKRVPGAGYSEFTTSKWNDRYLMMDTISKYSTSNDQKKN